MNSNAMLYDKASAFEQLSLTLSTQHHYTDALKYLISALKVYESLHDTAKIGATSLKIAEFYTISGEFEEAYIFYKKALFIYQERDELEPMADTLLNLGVMYRKKLDYANALFYLLEVRKLAEENAIKAILPLVYDHLGKTYRKIQKYNDAIDLHKLALSLIDQEPNDALLISCLSNLGSCYFDMSENLNALSYFESALSVAQENDIYEEESRLLKKISLVYMQEKDYDMALFFLKHALELFIVQSNERGICSCYLDLGYIYKKQSLCDIAEQYLNKALDLSTKLNIRDYILLCYKYLSEVRELTEDYQSALDYYKTYVDLKENIFTDKNNEYLAKMYAQYQLENKEKENEIYRLRNIELAKAHEKLQGAYKQLEYVATRDPLTGLLNRRALMEKIEYEKKRCKRYSAPMSIIISDIDNFKLVNDRYGHDVGDEILVHISNLFTAHLRECDAVCRWGGEEFLILLPDTNCEQACHVAEKLRLNVATHDFNKALKRGSVTMTLGVAEFKRDQTIKQWIKIADSALYTGKRLGRNRVVL